MSTGRGGYTGNSDVIQREKTGSSTGASEHTRACPSRAPRRPRRRRQVEHHAAALDLGLEGPISRSPPLISLPLDRSNCLCSGRRPSDLAVRRDALRQHERLLVRAHASQTRTRP